MDAERFAEFGSVVSGEFARFAQPVAEAELRYKRGGRCG